ncbi:MAG: outer membrane beta-barrel protein [Bacteroidota bacterium]
MKYIVIILSLMMAQVAMYAQTTETVEERVIVEADGDAADTTKITISKKTVTIIKDEEGRRIEIKDADDILDEAKEEMEARREDMDDNDDDDEDWDSNYDYEPKERIEERNSSNVGLLAFDLGITNYFANGVYGADAAVPELALRDFRIGSHVALHLFPTRVSLIGKGVVNLKTAVTIDWSNYYFTDNTVVLIDGAEGLEFGTSPEEFSKSKLVSRYAQIPLLLNFNTAPGRKNNVSLSVGGYGGLLWGARTKTIVGDDNDTKTKIKGDFGLNPFRYGLTARLDFRWFDIYVNYNLSEMFAENEGPSTQTFEAGVNLIDF